MPHITGMHSKAIDIALYVLAAASVVLGVAAAVPLLLE
jgi:hypothetical protein